MKALVIGQGGREHALVRALNQSPSIDEVLALPGSAGIAREARCLAINWKDTSALLETIRKEAVHLVVIGPEVPLVEGLADALRSQGVAVIGPDRGAALLEGSKVFSKQFMVEAGVPTARFEVVTSVEETKASAAGFSPPFVLKADGLAAGKGVFICDDESELLAAAHSLFVEKSLGAAGARALLEEFQPGYEISYLVLTDGKAFEPLILAQDHKRLRDGDKGPNTGGMGVVAPVEIDSALRERINREVIEPSVELINKKGFVYRGVLYAGLMITEKGPSLLEFNVRFGDPEAQAILPLLDGDWGQVFDSLAQGKIEKLRWKKAASACVVLAAEGYPDSPVKGSEIAGLEAADAGDDRYFLHAGTAQKDGAWVTDGGRVLNAVGVGGSLREAIDRAYEQSRKACWTGIQLRTDIGSKVL
jgi:phosphoribosylamine---glycine ligase